MKMFLWAISLIVLSSSCNLGAGHINEGMHYYSIGEFSKAKEKFLKAEDSSLGYYTESEFYTILGNTNRELGELVSAKANYKKALNQDDQFAEAYVNLGITHRLSGDFDQALFCYNKAKDINPNDAELHTSLGSLYIHKNKPQKAVKHLEKALSIDQNLMLAHSNYSLALALVGDYSKSEEELKIAESMGYSNGSQIRARISQIRGELN